MDDRPERDADPDNITVLADRRRPGRVNYQQPSLIALLRRPRATAALTSPSVQTVPGRASSDRDGLAAARGILVAIALSVVCWAGIAEAISLLTRH